MTAVRMYANRVLLAAVGLLLLAVGAAVLVGSWDLQRRWGFRLPSAWPFGGPDDVLLTRADRIRYRAESWWWPAVLAALTLLAGAALWWALAQFRSGRLPRLDLDGGDVRGVALHGGALEEVLAAEAATLDGVDRARVRLTGGRDAPRIGMVLTLTPEAVPATILTQLDAVVLAHARTATGRTDLPTEVRLYAVRHRAAKVA